MADDKHSDPTTGLKQRQKVGAGQWLVMLAAVLTLLPFAGKPFHFDDVLFLRIAQQIQRHPLSPYDFEYSWSIRPTSMWSITHAAPLNAYILAVITAIGGVAEPAVHICYMAMAAGCAWAMYRLAWRFCSHPTLATLLVVLSPGFLVTAANMMAQVPLLMFWLFSVCAAVRAAERDAPAWLWWSAVAAAMATLTNSFGVTLAPLLLAYSVLKRRQWSVHLLAFLLPVAVFSAWTYYAMLHGGSLSPLLPSATPDVSANQNLSVLQQPLDALAYLGGIVVWPIALLPLAARVPARLRLVVLVTAMATGLGLAMVTGLVLKLTWALMLTSGGLLIAMSLAGWFVSRNADSWLLVLWFLGSAAWGAAMNWTADAPILLPLFPAAVLVIRWIESLSAHRFWIRWLQWSMIPTLIVAGLVAAGDYQLAKSAKAFAQTIIRDLRSQNKMVLFSGHGGMQYYLEREGARPINFESQPLRTGDTLIYPRSDPAGFRLFASTQPATKQQFPNGFGLYTQSESAAFYTRERGRLPFAFGAPLPVQEFLVDRYVGSGESFDLEKVAVGYFRMGIALDAQKRYDQSVSYYSGALRANPNFAEAQSRLGLVLNVLDRNDEAIEHHAAAVRLNPDNAVSHFNFGIALNQVHRLDEAAAELKKAISISPDYAAAHSNLAMLLERMGKADEAIAHFRKVLEFEPENLLARSNLAHTLGYHGQYDAAVQEYQKVLSAKPDDERAHLECGQFLLALGKRDEAIQQFKEALRYQPGFLEAQANLDKAIYSQPKMPSK